MVESVRIPEIRLGRKIEGISAAFLPFRPVERIDWESYETLLEHTWASGLTPAVNMDTGFANVIGPRVREDVLKFVSKQSQGRRWIAGAFVEDISGELLSRYQRECEGILERDGIPILFQCTDLKRLPESQIERVYCELAKSLPRFLAFELGEMFAPFGAIYSLKLFEELIQIEELVGLKHSSLSRKLEWERLAIRDRMRPEFKVYTGNDLAIDMVQWGSDYLLGLSAFHPQAFALRDRYWENQDIRFFELNDLLQYLGAFSFRAPVPGYKHNCAMMLLMRGVIRSDAIPLLAASRPSSDRDILAGILSDLERLVG